MKELLTILLCSIIFCLGCENQNTKEKEIANIEIDFQFDEFHTYFFNSNKNTLPVLKNKYPYLFSSDTTDEEWISKINDSEEKLLYTIADSLYGDLTIVKQEIKSLYQHFKYYSPNFTPPKTITIINGLDYENAIVYADSLLFISLDMYLGKNSEVYHSFPEYISNNYTKERIKVDIAKKIIHKEFKYFRGRSFLESMIYFGKELYLLKKTIPNTRMYTIMGIDEQKYNWSVENESQIWKYFIANELLYSTESSLNNRFINLAPFSKFYLESDSDSPGSIGTWIGFKIVESYMQHNKTTLQQMLALNAETIFKKSKYKPNK